VGNVADLLIADANNAHLIEDWVAYARFSPVLIAKMTEGTDYLAPSFTRHRAGAERARLRAFGGFHFYTPGADPLRQAENAVAGFGSLKTTPAEWLILDVETGTDWTAYQAFVNHTDRVLGRTTWLYGGRQLKDAPAALLRDRPLWVARYRDHTPDPAGQPGIGESLWQFTDRYPVPGLAGGGDCSVHRGTIDTFLALIEGEPDMPLTTEDVNRVVGAVAADVTHPYTVAATRAALEKKIAGVAASVAEVSAKIDAIGSGGVDPQVIADAVERGVLAAFRKAGDAGP